MGLFFTFKITRRKRRLRRSNSAVSFRKKTQVSFMAHKHIAKELVLSRLAFFNSKYNFTYKGVVIRNQSSRWGSCSRRGVLNFNYRIALLRPELADYIVVHELCHLGEFNHSIRFWRLVEQIIPNWRHLRQELKKEGQALFRI